MELHGPKIMCNKHNYSIKLILSIMWYGAQYLIAVNFT